MSETAARRVLFVINSLGRGGAETQLLRVVREVQERGHDVALAVLNSENDFAAQIAELGIPLWAPAPGTRRWSPRHMVHLARVLRRWRPDVTVTFLFQATLFMRTLNVWLRPRRAISSMRNDHLESRLRSVLYRLTCWRDDVVVVNSRSAATTLQSLGTIPRSERVRVIYNGVDADALRNRAGLTAEETRRSLGVADHETLLLGVGRLQPQKDWAALVRALATTDRADLRCVIAGDGELRDELDELRRGLGLGDRVRLLGLRDDVPELMAAADHLVLTSTYEGTPNVVLEALAIGLPVVCTDVGACAELATRPGDRVIPPRDGPSLVAALQDLPARDAGGVRALADTDATQRFTWSVIGQQWTDLITDQA